MTLQAGFLSWIVEKVFRGKETTLLGLNKKQREWLWKRNKLPRDAKRLNES